MSVAPIQELPSPRAYWWLGHVPQLSRFGVLEFFRRVWPTQGDTFVVRAGARRMVAVIHPEQVEQVLLHRREQYVKARSYDGLRLLTGESLLTLEGDAWRRRRKLEQPSFHRSNVETLTRAMVRVTEHTLQRLRARFPAGGTMDAHAEMMRITLEIVSQALFGQAIGTDRADASGAAFAEALALLSRRGNALVRLPLAIPTLGNLRFRRALELLDAQTYRIIAMARDAHGADAPNTLLSMLLDAYDDETDTALDDLALRNEVITMFFAGHETTALLLTWTFTYLGRHPHVVERLREEIGRVVGERNPTMEDCLALPYLRQVLDEVLRLRAPIWTVARDATGSDELGGFAIRKGDIVLPVSYLSHRHPDFWTDPERFDPERFDPARIHRRRPGAYYPFSLGQRMCIGRDFSLVEAAVVIVMLLQRADLRLLNEGEIPVQPTMTLRPATTVRVHLAWRD